MSTYFHSAPMLLDNGSIVQPGNWGRILNSYTQNQGNAWMLAREFIFESVRASEFPALPGRLSSAFVFESLEHANQYRNNFSPWGMLYEVELVEPSALLHRGGFNLVTFPPPVTEFVPVTAQFARSYWRGENIEVVELLTKSPLRIKGIVSTGPGCYQP